MQINEIFDKHYRLVRQLGSGGFSEVWLAEDMRVHSLEVALKIYASGQNLNAADVEIFIHQFKLVYGLNHTNLLPPNAYGEFKNMPYLVLPYCEKGSCFSRAGNFSEAEAWRFLHDVASGLAYLHQKNIIHQDIKPANVLIANDSAFLITDFDISTQARTTLRRGANDAGGTSAYMSPERFGSTLVPVKASDVWALGASLFELLTGDLPFGEMGGLNQKSGAAMAGFAKSVSGDLQNIVRLCLQKEAWDRPTAEEIKEWCEQHHQNRKIRFGKKYAKALHSAGKFKIISKWISLAAAIVAIIASIVITSSKSRENNNGKQIPPTVVETEPPATVVVEETPPVIEMPKPAEPPPPIDRASFNKAKAKAIENYDFAEKMNDADYYPDALKYCEEALGIVADDGEMLGLRRKIEMRINKQ